MDKFKKYMQDFIDINFLEWTLVKSKAKKTYFKKGDIIHPIDKVCDKLYFINSGLARAFSIDENGKDYTWSIFFNDKNSHPTNIFVVDYESFLNQTPSRVEIEALEDVELIEFSYKDIYFLYDKSKKVQEFSRIMTESAYCYLHNLVLDRQTKTAKQRFEEFVKNTPHLLEKVPQYHIASLLDITPQHLSRLKKTLS